MIPTLLRCLPLALTTLLLVACATTDRPSWTHGGMVSAANPYAARAAADVLERGGSAVDAAIAAHAVLGLVEPQSSGIGGGAFLLYFERATGRTTAYDGRETAPAGARPDMFLADGEPLGFLEAWQSGLAVGTPGTIALYELIHARHGRLSLADDLAPAITLAREGFEVSPRLAGMLAQLRGPSRLDDNPATRDYFYPGGEPLAAGSIRDNPDYARTLSRVAAEGSTAFYQGELAAEITAAARAEPHPGTLDTADLAAYRVAVREPVCAATGAETICTMPPPSSGLTQLMILSLYDALAAAAPEATAVDGVNLAAFVDAQRLAYADRDHYVADADVVSVPAADLIDPAYLAARASGRVPPDATAQPGDPGDVLRGEPMLERWGRDGTDEIGGTTHLSVVDRDGNAVSMTATVEAPFGSSRWAGGFLLNNQMTDFSRTPTLGGRPVANRVEPGKRPRSSMSPVIVFDTAGELKLVAGSPGGNSIIAYVAKVLVGVLRGGQGVQAAVDAPNIIARGRAVRVETGVPGGQARADELSALGYPVEAREGENSGLHVILVTPDGLEGAADPRREGRVIAVH
ncbi:MAG: gamma-glutamyltransferase family protein [Pseudomonadales bacterium]